MMTQVKYGAAALYAGIAALILCSPMAVAEPPPAQESSPVEVADPILFTAPTGRIIPSGVIYPRIGADTSESFIGSVVVGLGGLVEFGFTSTPYVRWERPWRGKAEFTDGYPFLVGRIGLNEGDLWTWQPGIALGYRKSFVVGLAGRETEASELNLAVTKQFGAHVSVTLGVAKWGGSIELLERDADGRYELAEEKTYGERIRPFGGVELRFLESYRILLEYYYMPEFELVPADRQPNIELDAAFSVGLRSQLWPWLTLDVGTRGPDFSNLHQLDMEFFVQAIVPLRFLHGAIQ
jgi:hypothetical protein